MRITERESGASKARGKEIYPNPNPNRSAPVVLRTTQKYEDLYKKFDSLMVLERCHQKLMELKKVH